MIIKSKYCFWIFMFFLYSYAHAPQAKRHIHAQRYLTQRLQRLPDWRQQRWSLDMISNTSREFALAEVETGIPLRWLFALIEWETQGRWNHNRCDGNYGTRTYRGKRIKIRLSRDCGLTRQNTQYVRGGYAGGLVASRCQTVLGRRCRWFELTIPSLSVKLLVRRFAECSRFKSHFAKYITCYNSGAKAGAGNLKYYTRVKSELRRFWYVR